MVDSPLSGTEREQLEYRYVSRRLVELEAEPVRVAFDVAHLREVNRRLFQDLPALGFEDVTPGQFRPPVPEGNDWIKNKGLSTADGSFYVAYSPMDEAAQSRLSKALDDIDLDKMRRMSTADFTASLDALHVELDFAHPFSDGNSRTLRAFTKQLAKEASFDVDWNRFAASPVGRDLLYIARDRSVNALAKPLVRHEETVKKLI